MNSEPGLISEHVHLNCAYLLVFRCIPTVGQVEKKVGVERPYGDERGSISDYYFVVWPILVEILHSLMSEFTSMIQSTPFW